MWRFWDGIPVPSTRLLKLVIGRRRGCQDLECFEGKSDVERGIYGRYDEIFFV